MDEHHHEDLHFLIAQLELKVIELVEAHNKLVDLFRETVDALKELPCQEEK